MIFFIIFFSSSTPKGEPKDVRTPQPYFWWLQGNTFSPCSIRHKGHTSSLKNCRMAAAVLEDQAPVAPVESNVLAGTADVSEEPNIFTPSASDYAPKNILITGGAGFIASHVVILLTKKYPDLNIVCFDKLDYVACLKNLDMLKPLPNYKFIKGDICSPDLLNYVLKSENIDTVMHFAAQT